jgi:hypothetical protein
MNEIFHTTSEHEKEVLYDLVEVCKIGEEISDWLLGNIYCYCKQDERVISLTKTAWNLIYDSCTSMSDRNLFETYMAKFHGDEFALLADAAEPMDIDSGNGCSAGNGGDSGDAVVVDTSAAVGAGDENQVVPAPQESEPTTLGKESTPEVNANKFWQFVDDTRHLMISELRSKLVSEFYEPLDVIYKTILLEENEEYLKVTNSSDLFDTTARLREVDNNYPPIFVLLSCYDNARGVDGAGRDQTKSNRSAATEMAKLVNKELLVKAARHLTKIHNIANTFNEFFTIEFKDQIETMLSHINLFTVEDSLVNIHDVLEKVNNFQNDKVTLDHMQCFMLDVIPLVNTAVSIELFNPENYITEIEKELGEFFIYSAVRDVVYQNGVFNSPRLSEQYLLQMKVVQRTTKPNMCESWINFNLSKNPNYDNSNQRVQKFFADKFIDYYYPHKVLSKLNDIVIFEEDPGDVYANDSDVHPGDVYANDRDVYANDRELGEVY